MEKGAISIGEEFPLASRYFAAHSRSQWHVPLSSVSLCAISHSSPRCRNEVQIENSEASSFHMGTALRDEILREYFWGWVIREARGRALGALRRAGDNSGLVGNHCWWEYVCSVQKGHILLTMEKIFDESFAESSQIQLFVQKNEINFQNS